MIQKTRFLVSALSLIDDWIPQKQSHSMKPGYRIIQFVWWNNLILITWDHSTRMNNFAKWNICAPQSSIVHHHVPRKHMTLWRAPPTLNPKYYRTPPGHPWSQTFPGATLQPCTLQLLEARSRRMARPFSRTHSPGWTAVSFRLIRMRATENEVQ